MRAVRIHEFGGPGVLQIEEVPRPTPGPDEVLVRVRAAGVNPYDWMTRNGEGAPVDLPWIPGWDLAGTVEGVGADVTAFEAGDEVVSMLADDRGAYAEFVAVPAGNLVRKPVSLSHAEAAGVPMVALTAWQALFDDGGLEPGQRVLVHAAAGGVGHLAVQFANWRGATTVGTASGRNREYLDDLGLDEFVNYREEHFEDVVDPVDLVVDGVGGDTLTHSLNVLKTGGHVSKLPGPLTPTEAELVAEGGWSASYPVVQWNAAQLETIAGLLDDGTVSIRIDRTLPLVEVAEAHETSEAREAQGKLVLEP